MMYICCIDILAWIQALVVISASGVGIYGILSWRKEGKWKSKTIVAEEALTLMYQAQSNLKSIRSPLGWIDEGSTRKRSDNESSEEMEKLDRSFVVHERYNRLNEPFIKLQTLRHRYKVHFKEDEAKTIDEVKRLVTKIFIANRRLHKMENETPLLTRVESSEEARELRQKKMLELDAILTSHSTEDSLDEIDSVMNDLVQKVESIYNGLLDRIYFT